MGRILNTRQGHLDVFQNLIGIKSGLALKNNESIEILELTHKAIEKTGIVLGGAIKWWQGNSQELISVRVENLQKNLIHILHSLGAISNLDEPRDILNKFLDRELGRDFRKKTWEFIEIFSFVQICLNISTFFPEMLPIPDVPSKIETLVEKFKNSQEFGEYCRRNLMGRHLPIRREWNGLLLLSDLFNSEEPPINTIAGQYFDQRYIDYLNVQPEKIQNIQWRQFEYLTAEYFQRNGYQVEVCQGRKDGGKDVILRKEIGTVGPELIIVQCKRYAESNPVDIDTVKAFWTTVNESGATRGLIITTSRLTSGAKTFCEAHKYRLTPAESDTVRLWLQNLASPKT
ncbi:hypothetical protein NUACC21_74930 [Scytonema sp. NUACC21]